MDIRAIEIAENCVKELRNVISYPLTYTEAEEDGSITYGMTNAGQAIYDVILKETEKVLGNE